MRALLDILVEEKSIVKEIDDINLAIGFTKDSREHVIENGLSSYARRQHIKELDNELSQLGARKLDCEKHLKDIRNEIVEYLEYLL